MAHIVCITNGLTGLLFSSFEMVRRLNADGHRITYMAPAFAQAAVVRQGLSYQELPEFKDDRIGVMDHVAARLQLLKPDLALIDTELPEAVLSSHAAGLKTVLLNTWMSIWRHPGLPPLHYPIVPGVGFQGSQFGMDLAWLRYLKTRCLMDAARKLLHGQKYRRVSTMRAYAARIGFPHREEFDFDNWLLPFSFRTLPILVLHAHEFDFPHKPRDHVHYVGPMVNPERIEAALAPNDEAVINAVLARRREGKTRLVFGGFGSFFTADSGVLKKIVIAFVDRPDWELVVPLGERSAEVDASSIPKNVHVVSWAPQLTLLKHADVAIHHGGINTIDECIHFETPMLAYCGRKTDMPGNTARLVHHNLGYAGNSHCDSPEKIVERIDRLMADQDIAGQLRKHRVASERYSQERVLERTVEQFLSGPLSMSAKSLRSPDVPVQRAAASML